MLMICQWWKDLVQIGITRMFFGGDGAFSVLLVVFLYICENTVTLKIVGVHTQKLSYAKGTLNLSLPMFTCTTLLSTTLGYFLGVAGGLGWGSGSVPTRPLAIPS